MHLLRLWQGLSSLENSFLLGVVLRWSSDFEEPFFRPVLLLPITGAEYHGRIIACSHGHDDLSILVLVQVSKLQSEESAERIFLQHWDLSLPHIGPRRIGLASLMKRPLSTYAGFARIEPGTLVFPAARKPIVMVMWNQGISAVEVRAPQCFAPCNRLLSFLVSDPHTLEARCYVP